MKAKPFFKFVEYFRCWSWDGAHREWDTDYIEIPIDTPDGELNEAVKRACAEIKWKDNKSPEIVGYYCDCEEDDDLDENENEQNRAELDAKELEDDLAK